ncbi:MAG TPA: hypothetical protein VGL62_09275 [Vicinamibacterales bacterium]|jgi:hypothetical protein
MRSTLLILTAVLVALGIGACGATTKTDPTPSRASPAGYRNDGDNDVIGDADDDNNHDNDHDNSEDHVRDDNGDYHDSDDTAVTFGHAANSAETRAVTAVVQRYYAVAASGNGAKACTLLIPGLAATVVEDYGFGSAGPADLRSGHTCPEVLELLFESQRALLRSGVNVTAVRILEDNAVALLGSRVTPAASIPLEYRHGAWAIDAIIGSVLP